MICELLVSASVGLVLLLGAFMLSSPRLLLSRASVVLGTAAQSGSLASHNTMTTPYCVAYVTVPNEDTGRKLARGLVTEKLAACVNIVPKVTSIYEWQGQLEEDAESMLIIKTRRDRLDDLSAYVRQHHPYDVPEVISMPIENGNPAYLEWLGNTVKSKADS